MSTIRSLSRFFALMALLCLSACLAGCALPGLGTDKSPRTPGLTPGPCVVLVLPNTGNFAPISKKIENEMEYPGQIKVSVIRESRVTDFAK